MAFRSDPAPILPRVLRAVADSEHARLAPGTTMGEIELEWLLGHGLGPILHSVQPDGGYRAGPRAAARLRGADLTSRAITQQLLADVRDVLVLLRSEGIRPTVLKGLSYMTRYYPAPHLRIMGDVDLLVREEELPVARRALLEAGFTQPASPWRPSHHAPPLREERKGLWIELHHALRPAESPEAGDAPLSAPEAERRTSAFQGVEVDVLGPECELALIAASWCYDLKTRFGVAGMPRALIDAVHLLREASRSPFDWDKILVWSRGTYTGGCVAVLLTYLAKHDAYVGPPEVPAEVLTSQPFVAGWTLDAVHALLDRYVIAPGGGGLATTNTLGNAMDALIAPRRAWRNLLAAPLNVAFPARNPRRFRPGFILGRLRNALSARPGTRRA